MNPQKTIPLLHPQKFFLYFSSISAIPRGSGNEAAAADFITAFARARGLEFYRDDLHNVLIKAPATPGRGHEPAILLQGHIDMVCEKNSDTAHDFLADPLDLCVEGGWLYARGTTLGADNGVAVAAMLALLDSGEVSHPPLECLFTTEEETGLAGARGFDYSLISARRMINLDSEGEGRAVAGCCGGFRTVISLPCAFVRAAGEALILKISGLMGGHSGIDIGRGRANANKLMGRLLLALCREGGFNLASLVGGLADNAIPRECEAVILARDAGEISRRVKGSAAELAAELGEDDRGFEFTCAPCCRPERMMDAPSSRRAATLLGCLCNGVIEMSGDVPGLVEYSRNIGIAGTVDGGLKLTISSRSAIESRLNASADCLDALAELCGGSASHHNRYPGWKFEKISPLRDKYAAVCREVLGRGPEILAIHAGLECGIVKSALPEMDIISIGPDMTGIHTPGERLNIGSCGRFWNILVYILRD